MILNTTKTVGKRDSPIINKNCDTENDPDKTINEEKNS